MDDDPRLKVVEELSLRLLWHDEMAQMVAYVQTFGLEAALEKRLQDLRDLIGQQVEQGGN
jgi:hypothetical protein